MHRFPGKWTRRSALLASALIVCSYVAFRVWRSDGQEGPPPLHALVALSTPKIIIGPNVHVSAANASEPHRETVIAADPLQAQWLFAFAMYERTGKSAIAGYFSEDQGKSWKVSFEKQAELGQLLCDPSAAFGPDGACYFVCLQLKSQVENGEESQAGTKKSSMLFFRCSDGLAKWEPLATVQHDNPTPPKDRAMPWQVRADRPWLAIDNTSGKYRGRLYCASWLWLDTSADQGHTFANLPQPVRKEYKDYAPANPVILSDGRLVLARRMLSDRQHNLPGIGILMSDDGGQTLCEGPLVGTNHYDQRLMFGSSFRFMPQLAVDSSASEYRDRVYAVWEDGRLQANTPPGQPERPGPGRILFAYSEDKGKSWVEPMILSEQPDDGNNEYSAYMPAIAVNKAGHVAVTWYDRRGLPTAPGSRPPFYPSGCNVRMRVSQDGGETWQPSVQVNEKSIQASVWDLRDTAGLTADAVGTFHPVWSDDRAGTTQVWTAAVRVEKQ